MLTNTSRHFDTLTDSDLLVTMISLIGSRKKSFHCHSFTNMLHGDASLSACPVPLPQLTRRGTQQSSRKTCFGPGWGAVDNVASRLPPNTKSALLNLYGCAGLGCGRKLCPLHEQLSMWCTNKRAPKSHGQPVPCLLHYVSGKQRHRRFSVQKNTRQLQRQPIQCFFADGERHFSANCRKKR